METTKKYEVRMDDNEDRYGYSRYCDDGDMHYHVAWCDTEEEAYQYIKDQIDNTLREMADEADTFDEFMTMDLAHPVSFFISPTGSSGNPFFASAAYIRERSPAIWEELKTKSKRR
ncbi:MAG: hypothetical protein PHQ22_09015 [Sulfuricurvum sp.]|nr:hypothetical protein [Sulfuricurvum sp.]